MANGDTFIDRFCARWAPGIAAGRAKSRLELETVNSYRGASLGRTDTPWGWSFPYNNGRLVERLQIAEMRDRAQKSFANNPIAKSILQTEVTNVVADGLKLQAKATNAGGEIDEACKAWNSESEDRWDTWLENADVRGMLNASEMQRRPYRSSRKDGDGGILLVDAGGFSKLQHIPGNKIVTPDGQQGNVNFVDGIEVDAALAPIAYHILDLDEWGKRSWTRVPAVNFVFLCPDLDDDLAVRGPSCFSTIFQLLDQADGYVDGVATAARMATVFGLIIKSDAAPADFKNLRQITNAGGSLQRAFSMENGSLKLTGSKDDLVQVNAHQPMQQTPDFIRALLRLIGMPFDMSLELIAHDMSTVNFASARIGLLQYYRATRARQKWYTSAWSRIYRWWASRERKRQVLGLPNAFVNPFPALFFPHTMHCRAWDYTDPVREAQSDGVQIDMGVKSPQQVAAERGRDWEEVQIEQAAANAFRRAHGLATDIRSTLSRDVITVRGNNPASVTGEDQGAGTPEETDQPNKDEDDDE